MVKVQTNSSGKVYMSNNKALLATESGGGDTIYLPNESGTTIYEGDKVLFTLGSNGTDTPAQFTGQTSGTFAYGSPIVFDDSTFVTSLTLTTGAIYNKVNGTWTRTQNSTYNEWGYGACIQYFSEGVISGRRNGKYANTSSSKIYTKTNTIELSQNEYIGICATREYCAYSSGLYEFTSSSNTRGTQVVTMSSDGRIMFARIFDSKCIACTNTNVNIYEINTGTFNLVKSNSILSGSASVLFATGADTNDIVFVASTLNPTYYAPTTTPTESYLSCYKILSDGTLEYVQIPALARFESTFCYAYYDNRNAVLSIGTTSGAYFYQFDTSYKTFTQIDVSLSSLPTQTYGYPYRVAMTPSKDTIIVQGETAVNVYTLSTVYHRIVPNSSLSYDLVTSYTGFATGNTDNDGNYEISTVLPRILDTYLEINVMPDQVIVEGGAE